MSCTLFLFVMYAINLLRLYIYIYYILSSQLLNLNKLIYTHLSIFDILYICERYSTFVIEMPINTKKINIVMNLPYAWIIYNCFTYIKYIYIYNSIYKNVFKNMNGVKYVLLPQTWFAMYFWLLNWITPLLISLLMRYPCLFIQGFTYR